MGNASIKPSLSSFPTLPDSPETHPEHAERSGKELVFHHYPPDDSHQRQSYHGEWFNGKRNGKGTLTWINGAVYSGLWENDTLTGLGSFYLPESGMQYEGEFLANQFHGAGVLSWPDGRTYSGGWKDSKHHGFGVIQFAPTDARMRLSYRGGWDHGKRHGYGTMKWDTGAKYEGDWVYGKREGQGKQTFSSGDIHIGLWAGAKRHGPGMRVYENGDRLIGTWKNDHTHGLCEFHYAHGRVEERLYINGRRSDEPILQQVPSLKVLAIEALGQRKKLARAAEECLPEELATAVHQYHKNEAGSGLSKLVCNMFSRPPDRSSGLAGRRIFV